MTPELVATVEAPDRLVVPGSSTVDILSKETVIAPETPVKHSTLMGVSEVRKRSALDGLVLASSSESSQPRLPSIEDQEFEFLMNEVTSWLFGAGLF